ncbi:unnamed protein product, partial [Adineta steineri]
VPLSHICVAKNGKHTACDEQHELITHIELFDEHACVLLSHLSYIEHKIPAAQ